MDSSNPGVVQRTYTFGSASVVPVLTSWAHRDQICRAYAPAEPPTRATRIAGMVSACCATYSGSPKGTPIVAVAVNAVKTG